MVYELNDTSKVETLFAGMEDSMIRSCLEQVMGKVYVTDPKKPRSAMAFLACFAFYAGEPDAELAAYKPKGFVNMVAPDEAWRNLLEARFPDGETYTRYAIRKDTKFDRKHLEALVKALPAGYALRRIDGEIYDLCLKDDRFEDAVMHFESKEDYLKRGRGFAVMKDGKVVSAASSFTVYREGIEIEIDTAEEERRKGLASAVGAKLILSCLDDDLYPSWDAANMESVHLAEKLGYEFSHEYKTLFVGSVYDFAISDPDKSKWSAYCGKYEQSNEDFRLSEVFLKDGDLYGTVLNTEYGDYSFKLIPVGENTFGRNGGALRVTFGDGCLVIDGVICKKQ